MDSRLKTAGMTANVHAAKSLRSLIFRTPSEIFCRAGGLFNAEQLQPFPKMPQGMAKDGLVVREIIGPTVVAAMTIAEENELGGVAEGHGLRVVEYFVQACLGRHQCSPFGSCGFEFCEEKLRVVPSRWRPAQVLV
jgi:hypothetical protein